MLLKYDVEGKPTLALDLGVRRNPPKTKLRTVHDLSWENHLSILIVPYLLPGMIPYHTCGLVGQITEDMVYYEQIVLSGAS